MRLLICLLLLFTGINTPARAADFREKYTDFDFAALTKFTGHYQVLDLNDAATFSEYLQATECDLYMTAKDSQFTLQEMKVAVVKSLGNDKANEKEMHLKVPMSFRISRYNFDTQSFNVVPSDQLVKVNMLQITPPEFDVCTAQGARNLVRIPTVYQAKLNMPISLYRIPLQRALAQQIEGRLQTVPNMGTTRIIYGMMYVDIETLSPTISRDAMRLTAILYGQVKAIDLFVDPGFKLPISTLNYADGF